jgi:hypothetical protein
MDDARRKLNDVRAGSIIMIYYYAGGKSGTIFDIKKSTWSRARVDYDPTPRTLMGVDARPVKLTGIEYYVAECFLSWMDILTAENYGADPARGKIWYFVGDDVEVVPPYIGNVDVAAVKKHLDMKNTLKKFFPGGLHDYLNHVAPTYNFGGPSSSAAAPAIPAPAPVDTEAAIISRVSNDLRIQMYCHGGAVSTLTDVRNCVRCVFLAIRNAPDPRKAEEFTLQYKKQRMETPQEAGTSKGKGKGNKMSYNIPCILMGDRSYMGAPVFRNQSSTSPEIFNGYAVCNDCRNTTMQYPPMRISDPSKWCILCHETSIEGGRILCNPCQTKCPIKENIFDPLFDKFPQMFPHYLVRISGYERARYGDTELDYRIEAQYYNSVRGKWVKVLFNLEKDEGYHIRENLFKERERLIKVYARTLETYDKVVVIRVNHDGACPMPAFCDIPSAPETALRYIVARQWFLYFLQHMDTLPQTTLLYVFYPFKDIYANRLEPDYVDLELEDDIAPGLPTSFDNGRLVPFWKHACTGFAYAPPPPGRDPVTGLVFPWKYYMSNLEYKRCNPGATDGGSSPSSGQVGRVKNQLSKIVGDLEAKAVEAKYFPFPVPLKNTAVPFKSVMAAIEANAKAL